MFQSIHFNAKPRAVTNASKPEVLEKLKQIVGAENVLVEPEKVEPYGADAVKEKFPPEAVVFPETTAEMVEILKLANEYLFPVTARGGGVGYTGGAVPVDGGIVIGTDRMNKIIEINADDLYVDLPARTDDFRLAAGGRKTRSDVSARSGELQRFLYRRQHRRKRGRHANAEIRRDETFGFGLGSRHGDGRNYPHRRSNGQKRRRFRFDRLDVRLGRTFGNYHRSDSETSCRCPKRLRPFALHFKTMEEACKVLTKFTPEGLLPMAMEVIDKYCIERDRRKFRFRFIEGRGRDSARRR